jgi:hypothetical protein
VNHTLIEYDHEYLTTACIFLASKTEERNHYRLDDEKGDYTAKQMDAAFLVTNFLQKKVSESDKNKVTNNLIEYEKTLLKGIGYNLIVHHPYRALKGAIVKLAKVTDFESLKNKPIMALYDCALSYCVDTLRTDAPLLYSPGEVALAALQYAIKNVSIPSVDQSELSATFLTVCKGYGPANYHHVVSLFPEIDALVTACRTPPEGYMESIKDINKRLRAFLKGRDSLKRKAEAVDTMEASVAKKVKVET